MKKEWSSGFSLVELLIATAITMGVLAFACALVLAEHAAWRADSARVDLQQRARVVAGVLGRALRDAGAGPHRGTGRGPLLRAMAPVLPRRIGARAPDAADVFRADVVSVLAAREESEYGVLAAPFAPGSGTVDLAPGACIRPACGISEGQLVMIHDASGSYDVLAVVAVMGQSLAVRQAGDSSGALHATGSPVIPVESATFSFDRSARLLRRYDGDASDMPLMDDVVGMEVEYYGATVPPGVPRPGEGVANCLYDSTGVYNAALMPVLAPEVSLVRLPPETLVDGPWCGGGGSRFDADLLRVRRIRVVVRLQAADPAVRGANPTQFSRPGTARREPVMVPDVTVTVDVAPRNLREGW